MKWQQNNLSFKNATFNGWENRCFLQFEHDCLFTVYLLMVVIWSLRGDWLSHTRWCWVGTASLSTSTTRFPSWWAPVEGTTLFASLLNTDNSWLYHSFIFMHIFSYSFIKLVDLREASHIWQMCHNIIWMMHFLFRTWNYSNETDYFLWKDLSLLL